MDIKDLNKSQFMLLAILLSFVTSIATGITTVTLMQQVPTSVTVPINRVIRQTVEKIVPASPKDTVQTVIVKEEDLVVDAISKNRLSLFSITKEIQDLNGQTIEVSAGSGFLISKEGIIVADGSLVSSNQIYYVKNDNGKFKADFISLDEEGFSFLKIGMPLDEKVKTTFSMPTLGDLNKMKTGQKILVLGNTIFSFIYEKDKDIKIDSIKSNEGGMVLNLDGEVLGIALFQEQKSFISIDVINEALKTTTII